MGMLTSSNFIALTDSIGEQYAKLVALLESTEATDLAAGATANINRVDALADQRAQAELMSSFLDVSDAVIGGDYLNYSAVFRNAVLKIQANIKNWGTYLTTNTTKVSKNFADVAKLCGLTISPEYVFPAAEVIVASETVTAVNTGTFNAQSAIDPTVAGPMRLVARVTSNVTVGFTLNLTLKKFNNQTEVKAVVIPASATASTEINIGSSTDLYVDCTAIAVVGGGTADGAVAIVAKLLRTPAI